MNNITIDRSVRSELDWAMQEHTEIKTLNNLKKHLENLIKNRKNLKMIPDNILQKYWEEHGKFFRRGGKRKTRKTRKARKGKKGTRKH